MGYLRRHVGFALMGRSLFAVQAQLCTSLGARLRLLVAYGMLVLAALRSGSTKPRPRRLRIRAAGRERDWWVGDAMEVAALSEVFVGGAYGDWLPERPQLIVDAGANVGSATLWFRERFPDARIIAIEPNPDAFGRLQLNVGDDRDVELVNAALSATDGSSFLVAESMTPVGRLQDHGGPGAIEVETLTLATVRDRFASSTRIDMFKLDVEGAEWDVLATPLQNVGTVAIEIHDPVPGDRDPDALLRDIATRDGFELRQGYSKTAGPEKLRWLVRA